MILKQDLKWSPDGMRVEVIRAGEYDDGALPARVQGALQAGLAGAEPVQKAVKRQREKATTSKRGLGMLPRQWKRLKPNSGWMRISMLMTAICNCWPVRRKSGTETYLNRKLYAPDETIPDSDQTGCTCRMIFAWGC